MAFFVDGVPVAMPPPEGYVVDFANPQRNSVTEAYWLYAVGNALALLMMGQRVYVRAVIQKKVFLEDAFLGTAYLFSIVLQTLIIRDFVRGVMGTHVWEMSLTKFGWFLTALYQLPILYNPVQCGTKMALLLVYDRLTPELWFRVPIWITMFIVCGTTIILQFITIFPCAPVQAAWDLSVTESVCMNRPAIYKATAIMGAVSDAIVWAVPMPLVYRLQVPLRQKIGLAALFSVGALTVFTSIMRLAALIYSMGEVDQSWGCGPVLLWIFAEANLSVICGSLLTINIFVAHVCPGLLTSRSSKGPSYKQSMSNPPDIVTFGGSGGGDAGRSKKRRDKYSKSNEDGLFPLTTLVDIAGEATGSLHKGDRTGDLSDGGSGRGEDAGSTKRIVPEGGKTVQTKAMIVPHESR